MKGKWDRLLSLLLALLLMTSLFSGVASAEGEEEGEEIFPENSIMEVPEETLSGGTEPQIGASVMMQGEESYGGQAIEGNNSSPLEGEETLSIGGDSFEADEGSESILWGEEETLSAGSGLTNASLTVSQTSVTVNKGNSSTVIFKVSNFTGFFYLEVLTNNKTAYKTSWGEWNATTKIPLTITGKSPGSGKITVNLRAPNDSKIYKTVTINVTVSRAETGNLKLSASSAKIEKGSRYTLNATVSNNNVSVYLCYSNSKGNLASSSWGSWSGMKCPLYISGSATGTGTITVYLKSAETNRILDQKTFNYEIIQKPTAKVTLSASSISVNSGSKKAVTVTASGYSGYYYLQYSYSYSSYFNLAWDSKWSGNSIKLNVTGTNKVSSAPVYIYMRDSAGKLLASTTLYVTVNAKTPEITVSTTSVSLKKDNSTRVTCGYANVSETIYLSYSTTNTTAYSCSWGSWNSSKIPLTITGKSSGSGTVTVYLKRSSNGATLASKKISVTVTGNNGSGSLTIQDVAYKFTNYGNTIPLATCQMMYGKTETAKNIWRANIGGGGCCFGFATSSGILSVSSNGINPSSFRSGATKNSSLSKSDYSSSRGVTIQQFLEGMQVSQVANIISYNTGLSSLASAIKSETNAGRPVEISIWGYYGGSYCGHAILAFGYTETSSAFTAKIYDSNYGLTETRLTISKSGSSYTGWSYPLTSSVTWGSSYGSTIKYLTYSSFVNAWNSRPNLKSYYYAGTNMIITQSDNFSLYNFDDQLMAKYVNGVLTVQGDGVTEATWCGVLPDGSDVEQPHILYVPKDYYSVKNDNPGTRMEAVISDDMLSTRVSTDAEEFDFCAVDEEQLANAILTPGEDHSYAISIGSSIEGDPAERNLEGLGTGLPISMELKDGELSISGQGAGTLAISGVETQHYVSLYAGEGGSVSPEGVISCKAGDSLSVSITPDTGYVVRSVFVDDVDQGPLTEYTFEDITQAHSLVAEFAACLEQCQIELHQKTVLYDGTEKTPDITLTAPDGKVLVPVEDYDVYYEDNIEPGTATIYITATQGSAWFGVVQLSFKIVDSGDVFTGASYNAQDKTVEVSFLHKGPAKLITALYDGQGAMTAYRISEVSAEQTELSVSFANVEIPTGARFRVFLTDSKYCPVCGRITIPASN